MAQHTFRQTLMLFSACSLLPLMAPHAFAGQDGGPQVDLGNLQLAQAQPVSPPGNTIEPATGTKGQAIPPAVPASAAENIVVRGQRQLLREKNSPSAVTELGSKQISQVGASGSIATLLRQAPSVYVYQQGIGNNEPVLTIRGVRGLETAQTLDDVPVQDLLSGGTGGFLQNIIGGRFDLDQISGVSIYPGVAYPDKNTFGTIGGTVAYQTKRPDNDFGLDVFGAVGSFKTFNEGFTLNSGPLDSPLGTGDNAIKLLLQYSNLQTAGYVDYTPARYNNMEFALDKPYDDGLSKFQFTALYNTGNGLFTPEPVPGPYQNLNGAFSNYAPNVEFERETNDYLTFILKNDTYVNDYLSVGLTAFYENSNSTLEGYGTASEFSPGGEPNQYAVNGAAPFIQVPAGFGEQGYYGPGPNGYFYDPQVYRYNGNAAYPPGSAACPTKVSNQFAAAGLASPCGYNAQISITHNDTYGIQPRATISLPEYFGIINTIKVGGIAAKETSPASPTYLGGTPNIPETAGNLVSGFDGGTERTIYQGYIDDKIDLLDNTLHITPGLTIEGTQSSLEGSKIFGGTPSASLLATPYCQAGNPCLTGKYKGEKWDRDYLPFFNISYDLGKILPVANGVSIYGSTGSSALFAPTTDFGPNLLGTPPYASIVHLYEGGVKYNSSNLVLSANYFYQKVDRDFGFFQFQSGPQTGDEFYTNNGQREFKGFEAAGTYQLSPQWQLFGNVSHLLAKYLKTSLGNVTVQEDQFGVVQKGTPVTGVPDWLSTFGVDYTHKSLLRDNDLADIRFSGQYTGKQQTSYDVTGFQNVGSLPGVQPVGTYNYYNVTAGATTYDPNGGISPFAIFNVDMSYTLPTPSLPVLKSLKFDLNVQNLFSQRYFAYFYKQISPSACGTFTSGPFKGQQISNYGCTPEFSDGIPGQPFTAIFTMTAHF